MMPLADHDDAMDGWPTPWQSLPARWLPNGFLTLTLPDGSYRTFRVRTERRGALAGRRTLALLVGPDGTDEYEPFAFVADDGFQIWKRFQRSRQAGWAVRLWAILRDWAVAADSGRTDAPVRRADGTELVVSRRCLACNRVLRTPAAAIRGIGDSCLARMEGRG